MPAVTDATDATLRRILTTSATIAVLGIRDDPSAPGYYVPEYLHGQGYRIIGVNPRLAGRPLFGSTVVATLADLPGKVDLIDVFRRAEDLPAHTAELIAAHAPVVWFQLGIRNDAVAGELTAAGIEVVQDHCTLAEHRRLGLGAPIRD